jgi:hypothetical protein
MLCLYVRIDITDSEAETERIVSTVGTEEAERRTRMTLHQGINDQPTKIKLDTVCFQLHSTDTFELRT